MTLIRSRLKRTLPIPLHPDLFPGHLLGMLSVFVTSPTRGLLPFFGYLFIPIASSKPRRKCYNS